jgi:hypothetical protein
LFTRLEDEHHHQVQMPQLIKYSWALFSCLPFTPLTDGDEVFPVAVAHKWNSMPADITAFEQNY